MVAVGSANLDLGDAPGRANTGDKILTLGIRAGGDCIDDACVRQGWSTLGTFLRSFKELLAGLGQWEDL